MLRILTGALVGALLAVAPAAAVEPGELKVQLGSSTPPKELKEPIRQLLGEQTVQLIDSAGKPYAEIWFRKDVPVKATADDLKAGVRYSKVPQSTILAAARFSQPWSDFRRQRVKPGVYTLRFALQPMDGDHMGTAPFNDFVLVCPASQDTKPELMEFKEMFELSCKAAGSSHAAAMLLFPNYQPSDSPTLVNKGGGNYVLNWKTDASAEGQKGTLGLGLTLFGATTAE